MKLIGLGIFAGKKAVYENTLHFDAMRSNQ